jgi:hypothetical protein
MNRKFLLALLLIVGFVGYLSSCSKESADNLEGASATCDTTNVSYSQQVVPILQDNCYSCHSGTTPPTGISLDSYANLKTFVSNGFLVDAVTQNGIVTPMPYGLPELPSCEVNTIVAWVNQGALNN